jgi:hypothetical protein
MKGSLASQYVGSLLILVRTVDLHDPVVPLHDRQWSIQWFSKKSSSLKKPKGTNGFRDDVNSIRSKKPGIAKSVDGPGAG